MFTSQLLNIWRYTKASTVTTPKNDLRESIVEALDVVKHCDTGSGLNSSGRLQGLTVRDDGAVGFIIEIDGEPSDKALAMKAEAEAIASNVPGVSQVSVLLTAHSTTSTGTQRMRKGDNTATRDASQRPTGRPTPKQPQQQIAQIPGVRAMIAVASAKGGVGKSSVTINLAAACARLGLRVGILDADVYGPSIPTMLGTGDASPTQNAQGKLETISSHGLKTMSIGYLADTDAPMIWRGPVVTSALNQMMHDVAWGELDILFVDTPPGTGDIQLSLAQRAPLTGAIIVSTPQEVALADVRRGVAMFHKTHTPVIGLIENMAWFEDPSSGARTYIFGEGGAKRTAEALDIPVLGELPLLPAIREGGDSGTPAALTNGPIGDIFRVFAEKVIASLEAPLGKPAPTIIFE